LLMRFPERDNNGGTGCQGKVKNKISPQITHIRKHKSKDSTPKSPRLRRLVGWSVFEKIITRLDSMETIVSIIMLIGMVGVLGYLYLKLKKSK
jgi:hypothetical protein